MLVRGARIDARVLGVVLGKRIDSATVTGSCGGVASSSDADASDGYKLSLKVSEQRARACGDHRSRTQSVGGCVLVGDNAGMETPGVLGRDASKRGLSAGDGVAPNGSIRLILNAVDAAPERRTGRLTPRCT